MTTFSQLTPAEQAEVAAELLENDDVKPVESGGEVIVYQFFDGKHVEVRVMPARCRECGEEECACGEWEEVRQSDEESYAAFRRR